MARTARLDLAAAGTRLRESLPAIVQLVFAATAAYAFAHYALGHPNPFLAVTVCITSLGFARDARPRRVLESAAGIVFGVLFANVAILLVGRGTWQLVVVLVVVMTVSRFLHPSTGFATAASIQASLVTLIPMQEGTPEYARILDAVVGGVAAILATALVPRDARAMAHTETRAMLIALSGALSDLVTALRRGDSDAAQDALDELRRTQSILDRWQQALESATSIARVSPFLRSHRADLVANGRLRIMLDLSVRNLRVLARRAWSLTSDGRPRPELADVLAGFASGVRELTLGLDDPVMRSQARQTLTLVGVQLTPDTLPEDASVGEVMIIMQARPLVVDLLRATGLDDDQARACLPPVR